MVISQFVTLSYIIKWYVNVNTSVKGFRKLFWTVLIKIFYDTQITLPYILFYSV